MEINQLPASVKQSLHSPNSEVSVKGKDVSQSPVLSVDSPKQKSEVVSPKVLLENIEHANKGLERSGLQGLTFSIDEATQSSVVKLIDKNTEEVIKQYPSEDALRIFNNIQKYLDSVQDNQLSGREGLTGSLLNEII